MREQTFNVLQATTAHISDISAVISQLDIGNAKPSDLTEINLFVQDGLFYVALAEQIVVGAMALQTIGNSCEIYALASTKKGAGNVLVNYAIKKCKQEGIQKIWCWSPVQFRAKRFYEQLGFDEQFLAKMQWHGLDCHYFGKVIS